MYMFEKDVAFSERFGKRVFFGEREKSLENKCIFGLILKFSEHFGRHDFPGKAKIAGKHSMFCRTC